MPEFFGMRHPTVGVRPRMPTLAHAEVSERRRIFSRRPKYDVCVEGLIYIAMRGLDPCTGNRVLALF